MRGPVELLASSRTDGPAAIVHPSPARGPGVRRAHRTLLLAVGGFVLVGALAWLTAGWSAAHPPDSRPIEASVPGADDLPAWDRGWAHWDGAWYAQIAHDGYTYQADQQSSVAFFPAYPTIIHALTAALPGTSPLEAGSVLTAATGIIAAGLLFLWTRARLPEAAAVTTVLVLAAYPYSLYLYGAVYADALLLVAALLSFLLLEHDRPALAALAAATCSAARPVGILVVVALAVRCWELQRGRAAASPARRRLHTTAFAVAGSSGFAAYAVYLHVRFGDAFAFATTQGAPGWDQAPGPHTWFKTAFFEEIARAPHGPAALGLYLQIAITVLMLISVPFVIRRFGTSYGLLVALVVLLPVIGSKDFQGLGRYVLPAFPTFALLGNWLARHRRVRALYLVLAIPLTLQFTSWFAKGNYLA